MADPQSDLYNALLQGAVLDNHLYGLSPQDVANMAAQANAAGVQYPAAPQGLPTQGEFTPAAPGTLPPGTPPPGQQFGADIFPPALREVLQRATVLKMLNSMQNGDFNPSMPVDERLYGRPATPHGQPWPANVPVYEPQNPMPANPLNGNPSPYPATQSNTFGGW